jgi:hypothetical protein
MLVYIRKKSFMKAWDLPMRKTTAIASSIVMCLFAITLAAPLAKANETVEPFSVYTDKTEYLVGEVINIYVKANTVDANETITVTSVAVFDPSNASVAEWNDLSIALTTAPTFVGRIIAESEGSYTVSAEAMVEPASGISAVTGVAGRRWWIWRVIWRFIIRFFHPKVVPEVPVGTIVAMIGFVGATGLYVVKRKNPKE